MRGAEVQAAGFLLYVFLFNSGFFFSLADSVLIKHMLVSRTIIIIIIHV